MSSGNTNHVRLATFNILHGRSPADGAVKLARYAEAVRELDPDVLALQEVDRDQPRSQLADFTAVAAQEMGAVSHRFTAALAGTPGATWTAATGDEQPGSAAYGIALLSRYPVRSWETVRLPSIPFRFPMWLPGPRKVLVVREEPRVCLTALIDGPFGGLAVANTHLSFVPGWNVLQLRRLRRALRGIREPLLLMGDLNLSGDRPASITGYRPLARSLTFPADNPVRQLDHVLARDPFPDVRSAQARHFSISDHRALVVEI